MTVAVHTPLGRFWHLAAPYSHPPGSHAETRTFCGLPYSEGFDTVKQYRLAPVIADIELCLKCRDVRTRRRVAGLEI